MTGLTLKLRNQPAERLNLSGLTAGVLADLSASDAKAINVSTTKADLTVGDVFDVSGESGDTLTISGGSAKLDFIGAGLKSGTIIFEGDVGSHAAKSMKGGRLEIRGNAGPWLATGLSGGIVYVSGSAGDFLGAASPGERFGMTGGHVVIGGTTGARTGERMRRGTVIVRGQTGPLTGSRMIGGTIIGESGFGDAPGMLMRRGTLIAPSATRLLATFVDCGTHDLLVLRILSKYLRDTLGPLAPQKPFPLKARKYGGDLATIGKGEILILPAA